MTDDALLVSAKDLARTYNSRAYGDSWELVEDYWRVMDYAARRPDLGSQALASRLDLPRSRIRPWVRDPDGDQPPARPDAVRGIQTAESHGWLPVHYDTDAFPALNRAVAWIFSGGSIDTTWYVPLFTIGGDATLDDLTTLLEQLAVGCSVSRETEGGAALTTNQKRARFIAQDVQDYAEKAPAGLVLDSQTIAKVITAAEGSKPHTQTVARVMDFLEKLGKDEVEQTKRRSKKLVVVDEEAADRYHDRCDRDIEQSPAENVMS